jgi:hypothetical protein
MVSVGTRFRILTESVVDADRPSHSLFSLDGWEHFGGILECDWSLAQRVANCKEVDESISVSDRSKLACKYS